MAEAYVNIPRDLMDQIQRISEQSPRIAASVLEAGAEAVRDKMKAEFIKSAKRGYSTGYTAGKIIIKQTKKSTSSHPEMFIGADDIDAALRMKYLEGGTKRVKRNMPTRVGTQLQRARPFMGKVVKYVKSRECNQIMEDRFTKIIESL